jgi:carboxylate-amine ligase
LAQSRLEQWRREPGDRSGRLADSLAGAFSTALPRSVGLEEELILVDADSLLPVDAVDAVLARVEGDECFAAELRACQVELRTPVCFTAADAGRELASARRRLLCRLGDEVRLLAVGTHPSAAVPVAVTAHPRYRRIAAENPWGVRRGQPSALHVHVGMDDPEEALAVYNAVRTYLPELAALAANSPFFEGADSGLASARLKLVEDLPRTGIPPAFSSWQSLAEFALWARTGEDAGDLTYLWWDLRPRPDYGTLEFRVADTQLTPADSAAVAAVCQTLVAALARARRNGRTLPVHETERLAENRWRALRDGVDGSLVDPVDGTLEPTRERIARLLEKLEPHADELGCTRELAHARALLRANGAHRQREIASVAGIGGLLEWLAAETGRSAGDEEDPEQEAPAPVVTT